MRRAAPVLVLGLAAFALAARPARADGCYIPEKAIAKLPAIPAQRAVLSFRDGKETLIIESALEGEGREFGWVIPVPSRPESIEAATPGAIHSMAMGLQPRVVHDLRGLVHGTLWLCLLLLVLLAVWCQSARENASVAGSLINLLLALVVIFVLASLFLPAGMGARGEAGPVSGPGVRVLERGRVGSYEVAVVAAEGADALHAWLEREGLAIPEALREAIEDYVAREWRFVTAKLATDGSGAALPHPLRVSFPAERAVYPMKLTSLPGSTLHLEIYVVADKAAEAGGLRRVYCEQFHGIAAERESLSADLRAAKGPHFLGGRSYQTLGHPGLVPLLWDGCWVSKLAGELEPEAMREDFYIAWRGPAYRRQTFYSRKGAVCIAIIAATVLLAPGAAAAMILWGHREWTAGKAARRALLPAAFAAGLAFEIILLALPQIEVISRPGWWRPERIQREQARQLALFAYAERRDGESVRDTFRRLLDEEKGPMMANPYTGEPLREEDSPGNYTLGEEDGCLVFTAYGLGGTPVRLTLGAPEEEAP